MRENGGEEESREAHGSDSSLAVSSTSQTCKVENEEDVDVDLYKPWPFTRFKIVLTKAGKKGYDAAKAKKGWKRRGSWLIFYDVLKEEEEEQERAEDESEPPSPGESDPDDEREEEENAEVEAENKPDIVKQEVNSEQNEVAKEKKDKPFKCPFCRNIFTRAPEMIQHLHTHKQKIKKRVKKTAGKHFVPMQKRQVSQKKYIKRAIETIIKKELLDCPVCGHVCQGNYHLKMHMKLHEEEQRPKNTIIIALQTPTPAPTATIATPSPSTVQAAPNQPSPSSAFTPVSKPIPVLKKAQGGKGNAKVIISPIRKTMPVAKLMPDVTNVTNQRLIAATVSPNTTTAKRSVLSKAPPSLSAKTGPLKAKVVPAILAKSPLVITNPVPSNTAPVARTNSTDKANSTKVRAIVRTPPLVLAKRKPQIARRTPPTKAKTPSANLPESSETTYCETCGRIFARLSNLLQHKRSKYHQLETKADNRPYQCSLCLGRYAYTDTLKRHVKNVHMNAAGELLPENLKTKSVNSNGIPAVTAPPPPPPPRPPSKRKNTPTMTSSPSPPPTKRKNSPTRTSSPAAPSTTKGKGNNKPKQTPASGEQATKPPAKRTLRNKSDDDLFHSMPKISTRQKRSAKMDAKLKIAYCKKYT